jgi:hypothetical protein
MATKIVTKNSSTASAVPTASDLVQGELAVNVADKRLFTEDNAGAIVELGTNPSALTVTGEITANGGIALGDNDNATFGAGDDLAIYHNGADSWIANSTGNLNMQVTENAFFQILDPGSNKLFRANDDGDVELYHNGNEKLATTSTGIDVTGKITVDSLGSIGVVATDRLYMATSDGLGIQLDKDNNRIVPVGADGSTYNNNVSLGSSGLEFKNLFLSGTATMGGLTVGTSGTNAEAYFNNGVKTYRLLNRSSDNAFSIFDDSSSAFRLSVSTGGDISFYEDTGTTAKLFWDASAESLGIGTSSPTTTLTVTGSGANGIELDRNLAAAAQSARLFFDSSAGGTAIVNYDGDTVFTTGATAGSASGTERLRIDSSGNVGIGTSSPSRNLTVHGGAGNSIFALQNDSTGAAGGDGFQIQLVGNDIYQYNYDNGFMVFGTNNAERMRIDSSGNLLVGKSTTAFGTVGIRLEGANGKIESTRNNNVVMDLNRLTTNGTIANFSKDGTAVGSIGSGVGDSSASTLYIADAGNVGIRFDQASTDDIQPCNSSGADRDNAINLGASDNRFKDLYLSGAASMTGLEPGIVTIGTSSYFIGNATNGYRFNNAADTTNLMILKDDGNLLVGTTDSSPHNNTSGNGVALSAGSGVEVAVADGETLYLNRMGSNGRIVNFRKAGAFVAGIDVTTTAVAYNTSSDQRLKENIADADDAGSKIDAIQVRKYDWKADGSHQDYGMIAQELLEVAPEAVSVPEDSEEMMGVDYSKLVPMLIKEIQSLRNRVAQLEE